MKNRWQGRIKDKEAKQDNNWTAKRNREKEKLLREKQKKEEEEKTWMGKR